MRWEVKTIGEVCCKRGVAKDICRQGQFWTIKVDAWDVVTVTNMTRNSGISL